MINLDPEEQVKCLITSLETNGQLKIVGYFFTLSSTCFDCVRKPMSSEQCGK